MSTDPGTRPASGVKGLSSRLADDLLTLDKELGEIDLLISQARTEAGRHESRREAAAGKLASLSEHADPRDRVEQSTALIALTQRAALMETQVEVLDGKRRALARYRDSLADYIQTLEGVDPAASGGRGADTDAPMDPATARLLMGAQEDLRREIARQMHDGPAQSLTNIVLQAQIVERLVRTDPERAATEVGQLVGMVQQTLDATKTFIFDVRPMVLDDLGLVPTLRRATRERGRRANVPVEFESMGQDRRLPMDLESGLFRMLDEGLAAYLAAEPDSVTLRLDWSDRLVADMVATRAMPEPEPPPEIEIPNEETRHTMPPALAALVEERRAAQQAAAEAAVRASVVIMPPPTWREIQDRAASVGVQAALLADGGRLYLVADLPMMDGAGAGTT
jgi:two-component system, NarL family, sensor histidine kinase DegS